MAGEMVGHCLGQLGGDDATDLMSYLKAELLHLMAQTD
jgi:hypothetical protein